MFFYIFIIRGFKLNKREKLLKHFKFVVIFLIVSIIFECMIYAYNVCINNFYNHRNLIGNDPIEIRTDELDISEVDEYGYVAITYEHELKNVSNVKLITKEPNQDIYMRFFYNGSEKFFPKSNKEETEFKVYLDTQSDIDGFKIIYYAPQLERENIDRIIVNDNLDYMPKTTFSWKNILICFMLLLLIYLIINVFKYLKEKKIKVSTAFVILALFLGSIFCFANVLLSKYDEHAHFWRAYELSTGTIVSGTGNELPESIFEVVIDENGVYQIEDRASYEEMNENFEIELNEDNKTQKLVGATAGLSPFSYIPQLLGITMGRFLKLKPLIIALLGRFTNLIFYILLIAISIKLVPKEKWKDIIAIIGLLPMSINLAASLSPDAVIISTVILGISYILHLKFKKRKMVLKDALFIGIIFTIPIMCKIVYFPVLLLFFLIPKEKFKNIKQRVIFLFIILCITASAWIVWHKVPAPASEIAIRTNTEEQTNFILADPLRDGYVAVNTLIHNTPEYYSTMIGGWNTSITIISVFTVLLVWVTFGKDNNCVENEIYKFTKKEKILISVVCLISIALIFGGLYATWTRAQYLIVEGVQGRYFLPILFPILLIMEKDLFEYKFKNKNLTFIYLLLILYIPIFINTIEYFDK